MLKKLKAIGVTIIMALIVCVITYAIQMVIKNRANTPDVPEPYMPEEILRPESTFPDVRGLHLDTAVNVLYTLGIYYEIKYTYDENQPFMVVVAQNIEPESSIDKDKVCLLTVNAKEESEEISEQKTYPDVTGKKSSDALNEIINAGYGVAKILSVSQISSENEYYGKATPDMVIQQEIADGAYTLTVYVPRY